jgi:hypothetical protein
VLSALRCMPETCSKVNGFSMKLEKGAQMCGAREAWCQGVPSEELRVILCCDAGYIGTMLLTLYSALIMHSYIMSIVCCGLQVRDRTLLSHHMCMTAAFTGVGIDTETHC